MADGGYGLESRIARVEQRVSDLSARLSHMEPLAISVAQLTERVQNMLSLLGNIEEREQDDRRERRAQRRAMWSLVVVIVAALIGAAAVIVSSGGQP